MKYLLVLCALCFGIAMAGTAYADDMSNFKLKDLDGKSHTLEALLDDCKVLVIDFWGVGCKPCNELLPFLADYYDEYKDQGLSVVIISSDAAQFQSQVEQFFGAKDFSFLILRDPDKQVAKDNDAEVPPLTLVLTSDGNIVMRHQGYKKGQEKEIEKVIKDNLADKS
jgi:cytochrome c biogenesis protein CcmG, thiol:disulfide interchange protein DsbE